MGSKIGTALNRATRATRDITTIEVVLGGGTVDLFTALEQVNNARRIEAVAKELASLAQAVKDEYERPAIESLEEDIDYRPVFDKRTGYAWHVSQRRHYEVTDPVKLWVHCHAMGIDKRDALEALTDKKKLEKLCEAFVVEQNEIPPGVKHYTRQWLVRRKP